jgi:hypothetical protein
MRSPKKASPALSRNGARKPSVSLPLPPVALRFLIVLSVVYLILAGLFNAVSPFRSGPNGSINSNPDEQVHYEYVQQLASGHLPVFHAGGANYEAHQPPLYYLLCVPVDLAFRGLGENADADVIRWVSTLCGLALIWVVYFATRRYVADEPLFPVACAAFVALLPMNVSLCASISNDSLTNLVAAAGLWQLGRLCIEAENLISSRRWIREASVLGLIMGVGIWTKTSTLLLFPVGIAAMAVLALREPRLRKAAAAGAAAACAVGGAIGLPWLMRNTILYGDPVAQHIFVTAFGHTAHTHALMSQYRIAFDPARTRLVAITRAPFPGYHTSLIAFLAIWTLPWTFESFWGVFASMALFLPPSAYWLLAAASFASIIGAVIRLSREAGRMDSGRQALLWAYGAMIVLTAAAFVRFNLIFFQAQGRYFYTALLPIAFFFVLGLRQIEPKRYAYMMIGLVLAVILLLDVASIAMISNLFAQLASRHAG